MLLGCSASGRAVMVDDDEVWTNVDASRGLRSKVADHRMWGSWPANFLTVDPWHPTQTSPTFVALSVDTLHAFTDN